MKLVFFSHRPGEKIETNTIKKLEDSFEWIILNVFLTLFIIMIASQIALFMPSVRSSILESYYIEGEPLTGQAYLFVPCRMELRLIDVDSCPELKVLVNGAEKCAFEENTVLLELKDGDIVELDAAYLFKPVEVQISAVTENLKGLLGKKITAIDGITTVAKIKASK